jgi:DNA-binding transcriptional regulator GbsR (MarR family)
MKKSEREHKLYLIPGKKPKTEHPLDYKSVKSNISEITRNLFSDTWRSYLDEVYMVARHVNENRIKTLNKRELAKMKISARKKQQDHED